MNLVAVFRLHFVDGIIIAEHAETIILFDLHTVFVDEYFV